MPPGDRLGSCQRRSRRCVVRAAAHYFSISCSPSRSPVSPVCNHIWQIWEARVSRIQTCDLEGQSFTATEFSGDVVQLIVCVACTSHRLAPPATIRGKEAGACRQTVPPRCIRRSAWNNGISWTPCASGVVACPGNPQNLLLNSGAGRL